MKRADARRRRRDFARACIVTAAAPIFAGIAAPEEPAKPKQARVAAVEALMDIVRARYGKLLSGEQLREVQRGLERNVFVAERMKQFKLTNGDEPAFVFRAEV